MSMMYCRLLPQTPTKRKLEFGGVTDIKCLIKHGLLFNYSDDKLWFKNQKRIWSMVCTSEYYTSVSKTVQLFSFLDKLDDKKREHILSSITDFLIWYPEFKEDVIKTESILGLSVFEKDNSRFLNLLEVRCNITLYAKDQQTLVTLREKWSEKLTQFHHMFCHRKNSLEIEKLRGKTLKDKVDHHFYKATIDLPVVTFASTNINRYVKMPYYERYDFKKSRCEFFCMDKHDAIMLKLNAENIFG